MSFSPSSYLVIICLGVTLNTGRVLLQTFRSNLLRASQRDENVHKTVPFRSVDSVCGRNFHIIDLYNADITSNHILPLSGILLTVESLSCPPPSSPCLPLYFPIRPPPPSPCPRQTRNVYLVMHDMNSCLIRHSFC